MDIISTFLPTNGNGDKVLKFRVYVRIPGSTNEGATAELQALKFVDFELVLVDAGLVAACADNVPEI
jgi:hypothetical protein